MTPDLDQNLSLKASLEDKVTPALQKIKQGVRSTRDALNELVQSATSTEGGVSRAAEGMASKTSRATERLQKDLKETGGAFGELSKEATTSSQEIGQALQESLYSRKAEQKLKELDKELGGLKGTLEGLASTSRPTSTKARRVQAIGKDTLNKQVIPAFQELHATLDEYPDVLREINLLEGDRMGGMKRFGDTLQGVSDRVSGFGDTLNRWKLGIEDFAAAITSGAIAIEGLKLRELQSGAGRTGGLRAFRATANLAPDINFETKAPSEVWQDAYMTLLDISKQAHQTFPYLLGQMVELEKLTGLSSEQFARLNVKMVELGNVKTDAWRDLGNEIHTFAVSSRASVEELAAALENAADSMVLFSRESRKAYAESMLAATAAKKELGLEPTSVVDKQQALQTYEGISQAIGLLNKGHVDFNLQAALNEGRIDEALAALDQAAQNFAVEALKNQQFGTINGKTAGFNTPQARTPVQQQFGLIYTPDELAKLAAAAERGQTPQGVLRDVRAGAAGQDPKAALDALRGTLPELVEQFKSTYEAGGFILGNQQLNALESIFKPGVDYAALTVSKLAEMDRKADNYYSAAISFFLLGQNFMSAIGAIAGEIPLVGGLIQKLVTNPLGQLLGAGIVGHQISNLTGGEGITGFVANNALSPENVYAASRSVGMSEGKAEGMAAMRVGMDQIFNRTEATPANARPDADVRTLPTMQDIVGPPPELSFLDKMFEKNKDRKARERQEELYNTFAPPVQTTAPQVPSTVPLSGIDKQQADYETMFGGWKNSPYDSQRETYKTAMDTFETMKKPDPGFYGEFDPATHTVAPIPAFDGQGDMPSASATPLFDSSVVNEAALGQTGNTDTKIEQNTSEISGGIKTLTTVVKTAFDMFMEKYNAQQGTGSGGAASATDAETKRALSE